MAYTSIGKLHEAEEWYRREREERRERIFRRVAEMEAAEDEGIKIEDKNSPIQNNDEKGEKTP